MGRTRPLESARCAALLLLVAAMSIDWPAPKVCRPGAAAADEKPSAVIFQLFFLFIYLFNFFFFLCNVTITIWLYKLFCSI